MIAKLFRGYDRAMTPSSPTDPIAAVTHPDPYPYYAAPAHRYPALPRRDPWALGRHERRSRDRGPLPRALPGPSGRRADPQGYSRLAGRRDLPPPGANERPSGPLPHQSRNHRDPLRPLRTAGSGGEPAPSG